MCATFAITQCRRHPSFDSKSLRYTKAVGRHGDNMVSMQVGIADGWFNIRSDDVELLTDLKPQSFREPAALLRSMVTGGS